MMAPEVAKKLRPEGYSGQKADIYSFGCTLYSMAYLEPPIDGDSLMNLFSNIDKCEYCMLNQDGSLEMT